jgi:hypothetical protein
MANRRFIDFPIAASVGDNDIVLIWQDGLNKQTTKATLLQGSPQSLAGLTDVDIAGLTNGQILQYNSTLGKWENVDRTDINLSELGDVTIVAPTNGQVLVYNSSTSKWENSSGGYVPYTGAVTTVNLGAQSILAGSFVKAGGTSAQFLKADGSVDSTAYGTGSVTSVGLTMPSAFSVANSPVTTAGTLAVTATGTTAQYIRGDGSLATFPGLTGFVPYTGATADVNLGTHDLAAERGTFANNGSSDTLTVNHTSGSGYGIIVTKGGANEALYVSKTSGSGNAMTVVGGRTSLVDLALSSVTNTAGDFLTLSGGVVHKRTAAQTLTDIGGQAALTNPVTGTGTTNYLPKFTGSTTIGNSQVFDDGTNVGIGIVLPSTKLHVSNNDVNTVQLRITNDNIPNGNKYISILAGGTSAFGVSPWVNSGVIESAAGINSNFVISNYENGPILFQTNNRNTRVEINGSGNVLIGSPPAADNGAKLQVSGRLQVVSEFADQIRFGTNTSVYTNISMGTGFTTFDSIGGDSGAYSFRDDGVTRMFIDSSGNLGLGVTPSAWFSSIKSLQISTGAALWGGSLYTGLSSNYFINTSGTDVYIANGFASSYLQVSGEHRWYTAPSGTAGNAISFTQAMTLTSGGNVLIGTTTSGSSKLRIVGLPTSAVGLSSGDVYNLAGVLMIA